MYLLKRVEDRLRDSVGWRQVALLVLLSSFCIMYKTSSVTVFPLYYVQEK